MEVKAIVTRNLHLHLTEDEAEWLHTYVQNPVSDKESTLDAQMRELFFNATKST